jgi:hypothetical protein
MLETLWPRPSWCHLHARQPLHSKESGLRPAALLRTTSQTWDLADALFVGAVSTQLVDPAEAIDRAREAATLGAQVRHDGAACVAAFVEDFCRLVIDGRLDLVEHSVRETIERFQHEGWIYTSYVLLATTLFWAGRWV